MEPLSTQNVFAISTRDLSKNPSKALRDVSGRPLIVLRHQKPVACLVSIEQWAELIGRLKDFELSEGIAAVDMHSNRTHTTQSPATVDTTSLAALAAGFDLTQR